MKITSKNLELAVGSLATLPGIGRKSALRIALHLLNTPSKDVMNLIGALSDMKKQIQFCSTCFNLSDGPHCSICLDKTRNNNIICVVESIQDVMAIEETGQYNGVYHVLGGVISPIEGVGPEDLRIDELISRLKLNPVDEVILAVSPTIDGETTIYYLSKKLAPEGAKITQIARGVAFGGELQYTDEITLGRSILARIPYTMNGEK
jgi:recombination protein RecR